MKFSIKTVTAAAFLATLLLPASSRAGSAFPCANTSATKITTIVDTDGYVTMNDMNQTGFTSLLTGSFDVTSASPFSCIVAQLSAHSLTALTYGDDYVAFQVLVDNQPMWGHLSGCQGPNGTSFHCLLAANNTDGKTMVDSHSYGFVLPNITPGLHRIEVRYAGCCSGKGAYVGGTVLTVHHEETWIGLFPGARYVRAPISFRHPSPDDAFEASRPWP